jgi:hypothetical protein
MNGTTNATVCRNVVSPGLFGYFMGSRHSTLHGRWTDLYFFITVKKPIKKVKPVFSSGCHGCTGGRCQAGGTGQRSNASMVSEWLS